MKKRKYLGIGLGLLLMGLSGSGQAQTSPSVYLTTIPMLNDTIFQVEVAGSVDRELSPPAPAPTGQQPARAPNDFDGNGRSDILFHNRKTGEVAMWLVDTNGALKDILIATRVPPDTIKAMADFKGDGRVGIFRHDSTTGEAGMWFMAADGTVQDVPITYGGKKVTVAPGWHFAGVGNFSGEGRAEILWRSPCGQLVLWFMAGATIVNGQVLADIPLEWELVPADKVDPLDCPSG